MKYKKTLAITTGLIASLICSSCATNSTPSIPKNSNLIKSAGTQDGYPIALPMLDPTSGKPKKDHYLSPFSPYNPIDAKGFKSGQLAGDPSTIKTDKKTGKQDKSTMKIFKLP